MLVNPFKYTDRYVAKYWIKIMAEYIGFLEARFMSPLLIKNETIDISSFDLKLFQKKSFHSSNLNDDIIIRTIILNILINIETYFNTKHKVFYYNKYYKYKNPLNPLKPLIIIVPLYKTSYFNTLNFYQKDLNYNNNKTFLIIRLDNKNKIISLNINKMPKIHKLSNDLLIADTFGLINQANQANRTKQTKQTELNNKFTEIKTPPNTLKNPDLILLDKTKTELAVKKKKQYDFEQLIKSCHFTPELHYIKNSLNHYKNESDCVNIGGSWL
jgi:hypothetical protein